MKKGRYGKEKGEGGKKGKEGCPRNAGQ